MKSLSIFLAALLSFSFFSCNKEDANSIKPSQEYTIKGIKYTLEGNDGDSLFFQRGETYSFDNNSSLEQKMSFGPFVNITEFSRFKSQEDAAFPWTEADSVMVEVPTQISGNKVLTNGEQSPYSRGLIVKDSKFKKQESEKINIPLGESKFVVKMEFRKRRVTYTLHLTDNKTNKDKIITGKWVETVPTGNYEIDWK